MVDKTKNSGCGVGESEVEEKELTNSRIRMMKSNPLVNLSPIWLSKVRFDTCPRYNINTILCMMEWLKHSYKSGPGISFFIHTSAIIVQFYYPLLIHLGHFIHYAFEPLEWTLFPCHPIEVGFSCIEWWILVVVVHC